MSKYFYIFLAKIRLLSQCDFARQRLENGIVCMLEHVLLASLPDNPTSSKSIFMPRTFSNKTLLCTTCWHDRAKQRNSARKATQCCAQSEAQQQVWKTNTHAAMNLTTAETFEIHFIQSLICSLQRVKITQKVPFTFQFSRPNSPNLKRWKDWYVC